MKKTLLTALMCVLALTAFARPVGEEKARQIAQRILPEVVNITPTEWNEVYLFTSPDNRGFVLVSADDCTRPLLAYSTTETFRPDAMPWHVAQWVDAYRHEIADLRQAKAIPSIEVQQAWQSSPKGIGKSVPKLMMTTWNQAPYYNSMCPYSSSDDDYAVTGCVATAQAQIMKYWNHPAKGHGDHGYKPNGFGYTYANFDTLYSWDIMPNSLNYFTPQEQVDAVALLMYHIGVAVEMNYGVDASGAQVMQYDEMNIPSSERSLKENFRYSSLLHAVAKNYYTDHAWDSLLRFEIDHQRPVLYTGFDNSAGHAFVVDGYDTTGMFHVNWGWGGAYDGYYTTDSLSPGAGGIGGNATYTFNLNNAALVYIMPTYGDDTEATVDVVCHDPQQGTISGNGTFVPYTTSTTILASAAEGYRFDHWASDYPANPVHLYVNGGYKDTAYFVPLGKDTISYSLNQHHSSWQDDYGTITEWGIAIPPQRRESRRSLSEVEIYISHPGYYTLNIYVGDEPQTDNRIYTYQHNLTSASGWTTITLDSPLPIRDDETLWVTFRHNSSNSFPAAYSAYGGIPDGTWYHLPDGWTQYSEQGQYLSWMIRALFVERNYIVDLQTDNIVNAANISGGGEYAYGETCTLLHQPTSESPNYQFSYWDMGNGIHVGDNPYSFTVTQDTLIVARAQVGIDDISADNLHVQVVGHSLILDGDAAAEARLYSLDGRLIGTGRRFDHLPLGLYLLRCGQHSPKKITIL